MKRLLALAFVLVLSASAWADSTTPMFFQIHTNRSTWVGAPAIRQDAIGLIHPASGTTRLGDVTLLIEHYEYAHYLLARGVGSNYINLVVDFDSGKWSYDGPDGTAKGTVTASW